MILYHGSNLDIEKVDLTKCRPNKDFGTGFYLTEIKEQAEKMASRVARIRGGEPIVNVYSIDDEALSGKGLNIKNFGREPSKEWAEFVMNNRNRNFTDDSRLDCNRDNKYDIVIGPVANDEMALLFRQYENGWLNFGALLKGLAYKSTTNQYSFHTGRAVSLLRKEESLK